MISNRLLNEFKSNRDSTVIITDISCSNDSCGQEVLSISTKKILTPFECIIKNYDTSNKTLEVEGQLELNDNKEYYTNLIGFISNEEYNEIDESTLTEDQVLNNTYRSPSSHSIEEIKTPLSKEIEINFSKEYNKQPHVVITIDKQYEDLYRSYSTEFIKNNLDTEYIGVKITFNNLKSKNSYPEIGICIIGDPIESYYDGIIKTEATTNIHIFKTKTITDIYIFEMINMEKGDVKNVQVDIIDEEGNTVSYTSDNCGSISPILKYGTYTIKINDPDYKEDETIIEVTPAETSFEIEAVLKESQEAQEAEETEGE